MKKRKFTTKFKTRVVLEALKEVSPLSELAKKYELAPLKLVIVENPKLALRGSVNF